MGLLKKTKRKATVNQLADKVKQVNDLEAMGLLTLDPGHPQAVIYRELWAGRDKKYKENFCQNVFRVWSIIFRKRADEVRGVTFSFFDKETSDLLGTYSDLDGFRG